MADLTPGTGIIQFIATILIALSSRKYHPWCVSVNRIVHSFFQMNNHYHLLAETVEANLARADLPPATAAMLTPDYADPGYADHEIIDSNDFVKSAITARYSASHARICARSS